MKRIFNLFLLILPHILFAQKDSVWVECNWQTGDQFFYEAELTDIILEDDQTIKEVIYNYAFEFEVLNKEKERFKMQLHLKSVDKLKRILYSLSSNEFTDEDFKKISVKEYPIIYYATKNGKLNSFENLDEIVKNITELLNVTIQYAKANNKSSDIIEALENSITTYQTDVSELINILFPQKYASNLNGDYIKSYYNVYEEEELDFAGFKLDFVTTSYTPSFDKQNGLANYKRIYTARRTSFEDLTRTILMSFTSDPQEKKQIQQMPLFSVKGVLQIEHQNDINYKYGYNRDVLIKYYYKLIINESTLVIDKREKYHLLKRISR